MKIQLPDYCPVCGAKKDDRQNISNYDYAIYFECGTTILFDGYVNDTSSTISPVGKCADKVLEKFGNADTTGYEEKQENEDV